MPDYRAYIVGHPDDAAAMEAAEQLVVTTALSFGTVNGIVGGGQIGYNCPMRNWLWGLTGRNKLSKIALLARSFFREVRNGCPSKCQKLRRTSQRCPRSSPQEV
jgi:hypothetical protein